MRRIDELFMEMPFLGSRQMRTMLRDKGHSAGRGRIRRLMRQMGLMALYAKPRTSTPHPEHAIYPYLLRNMQITKPNQVWCADITYIIMKRGYLGTVASLNRKTRISNYGEGKKAVRTIHCLSVRMYFQCVPEKGRGEE
jgi:putative transposase